MPKVRAKEVVKDIRTGLDDASLMAKYHVSASGLRALFGKLIDMNALTEADLAGRAVGSDKNSAPPWKCPQCGKPQFKPLDECLDCGVIVSKFLAKEEQKNLPRPPGSRTSLAPKKLDQGTPQPANEASRQRPTLKKFLEEQKALQEEQELKKARQPKEPLTIKIIRNWRVLVLLGGLLGGGLYEGVSDFRNLSAPYYGVVVDMGFDEGPYMAVRDNDGNIVRRVRPVRSNGPTDLWRGCRVGAYVIKMEGRSSEPVFDDMRAPFAKWLTENGKNVDNYKWSHTDWENYCQWVGTQIR